MYPLQIRGTQTGGNAKRSELFYYATTPEIPHPLQVQQNGIRTIIVVNLNPPSLPSVGKIPINGCCRVSIQIFNSLVLVVVNLHLLKVSLFGYQKNGLL